MEYYIANTMHHSHKPRYKTIVSLDGVTFSLLLCRNKKKYDEVKDIYFGSL